MPFLGLNKYNMEKHLDALDIDLCLGCYQGKTALRNCNFQSQKNSKRSKISTKRLDFSIVNVGLRPGLSVL